MKRLRQMEHPRTVAAAVVLWLLSLVPLWSAHTLPLYDWPNQIAAVASWLHFHDPSYGLAAHYRLQLAPVPYWGFLGPVFVLAHVFPVELAGKLWLTVLAAVMPLGAVAMARQFGRSPGLVLFTLPLLYNYNLAMGFVAFQAGLALLPWGLWAVDVFLSRPSLRRGAVVLLLAVGLYFCHPLPWMFFGVAAVALAACRAPRVAGLVSLVPVLLPSLLLGMWGFRTAHAVSGVTIAGDWPPLLSRLSTLPYRLLAGWASDGSTAIVLLLGLLWIVVVMTARTDAADSDAARDGWPYRLELVFGLAVLAALLLPESLTQPVGWTVIASRFWVVAALLAALLPHGPIVGNRVLLLVAVAVLTGWYPLRLGRAWSAFDRRAASLRRLLIQIPRGSSTYTVRLAREPEPDLAPLPDPWEHAHAWPQVVAGGLDPFGAQNAFPLEALVPPIVLPAPGPISSPKTDAPGSSAATPDFERFDYLLTQAEPRPYVVAGDQAFLVAEDGSWRLYRLRKGEP